MAEKKKTETASEARQGRRGIPVLVILVVSLALAAIIGVVWWTFIYGGGRSSVPEPAQTLSRTYRMAEAHPGSRNKGLSVQRALATSAFGTSTPSAAG